jgi:murein DD-endopeptidase MepM/ murein hydrolase activator NlpD
MIDSTQTSLTPAAPDASSGTKDAERARVVQLAQQFEAMLMTQMLRSMRQSMVDEDEQDGFGKSTMTDAFDAELGQQLTRAGGIGLTSVLVRAFDRQTQPGQVGQVGQDRQDGNIAPVAPVANSPTASAPHSAPATAQAPVPESAPVLPEGRVTSAFGWRSDPFNGKVKFHRGTDVRMAYGQGVKSAAGGKITFVGEQSGYGLTVMVDHGNGVESRYAHLSSAVVRQGEVVESGQVIARSGNSGRSTGPHLHFEVLADGKAVAPETLGDHPH